MLKRNKIRENSKEKDRQKIGKRKEDRGKRKGKSCVIMFQKRWM